MSRKKTMLAYTLSSLLLYIFQFVYHKFSHGVVSFGLKYVWILPLIFGLIIILLDLVLHLLSNRLAFNFYNISLAVLVNAFILKGILDIAGSDSPYIDYFYLLSLVLIVVSLVSFIVQSFRKQTI
ncbi:hypothetical protein JNUCC83_12245 [Vagococcus sp. JNUCC 83]